MGLRTGGRKTAIAKSVANILTAAAIGSLACSRLPTALAQEHPAAGLRSAIPAQSLADALSTYAQQTGLQLVYVSGLIRKQRSHAVPAGTSADEALTLLLTGTNLRYEYLTGRSVRIVAAAAGRASEDEAPREEVIVTASRRQENVQNLPMTVQVLTGATLGRLDITSFDDLVGYLPGVTAHGVGPAQNNIYIRGLGTGEFAAQAAGANGSFPNVAIYLDEQSAQLPDRNLDVYVADLDRIEVLEGPQGTLFGAGAQAGVVRYITNKPRLNLTEAFARAEYGITAHGDPSTALQAVLNLPLVTDHLAIRGVVYNEKRGGYIDNIPGTFARSDSDRSIWNANYPAKCQPLGGQPPCEVPPNSVVINNSSLVGNNINPVTYQGIRGELLYQMNENWSALLAQSWQNMDAEGVSAETTHDSLGQPQPALTVQLFNPSYNKDRFENTALTVEGRLGPLEMIYAGSYLVRNIDQVQDYTNYARGGVYVDYYQCVNPSGTDAGAQCFSPSSTWHDRERNTHLSQELRVKTPDSWRLRAIGGLFYEKYQIQEQADWNYLTAFPYFNPVGPPTGYYEYNGVIECGCALPGSVFVPGHVTLNNPNVRPLGDAFFDDITRGYDQKAVFTSVDFEVIPQTLTVSAGSRYFRTTTKSVGATVGSYGCSLLPSNLFNPNTAPGTCIDGPEITDLDALGLKRTFTGFRSRAGLSWRITEEAMLYYTWAQGFRAGGFNRGFSPPGYSPLTDPGPNPPFYQVLAHEHRGYSTPRSFAPDDLTSHEIGWKTRWLDRRVAWNGAVYQENWDDVQIGAIDATVIGDGVVNGGNYRVRGLETSLSALIGYGFSVEAAAAWNHSELIKQAIFYWNDGTAIDFSQLQIYSGQQLYNPGGNLGDPLAGAPPFQGNIRLRYEVMLGSYTAFVQMNVAHQARSIASTDRQGLQQSGTFTAIDLAPFTTYSGALGVARDDWTLQLAADNLTDTRAQLYKNYSLSYEATTVNRPRTVNLRFSYHFASE